MSTVRICVCGDKGVGKSSLIAGLVKDTFITKRIQPVLPQITIPPLFGTVENVTTVIVDTSALPEHRDALNREIKKSNVILLVFADHYSCERLGLFWLPHFRSLGVNVPVILCAAKSDAPEITGDKDPARAFEDETLPLMSEFKEVDSCVRTSAKEKHNVREAFFLCQKAVTDPVAPLYDSKDQSLKPSAVQALTRIFWLADQDKDGYLSDMELQALQSRCFGKALGAADLQSIKQMIESQSPTSVTENGITGAGWILINKYFVEKGRHETVWIILRAYHYSDSLSLRESFIHPKLDVPAPSSAELSPVGYQFFFDLFLKFDQDKDGGLNDTELAALFKPTPGLPRSWTEGASAFPSSTVHDEGGHITLQGWLAQWSMTTFQSPRTTLEYLAYLGFEHTDPRTTNAVALKVTKPRKRGRRAVKTDRNVVQAYIVGGPGVGKSSLMDAFLNRPFAGAYRPTLAPRTAVNSVELPGGKQCYLILEELGPLEPAVLDNIPRLEASDLIIYAYDSGDPDSFSHLVDLRASHPYLAQLPAMVVALKADTDRAVQRAEHQPDDYCAAAGLQKPHHVSTTWRSIQDLFVTIADTALHPSDAFAAAAATSIATTGSGNNQRRDAGQDATGFQHEGYAMYLGAGAALIVAAAGLAVWRKSRAE